MRILRWLLAAVFGLALLVSIGTYVYLRAEVLSQRETQRAELAAGFEAHHETFLADQQFAAALPVFSMEHGGGNAGTLLNPGIEWGEHPSVAKWKKTLKGDEQSLVLPEALRDRLGETGWPGLPAEVVGELDFAWMAALKDFGHWDLETHSPLAHAESMAFYDVPLPSFFDLLAWAKLRLLKGIHESELPAAIEEVRHLGRLLLSTEILLGEMVGLAVLGIEDDARTHLVEAGVELPADWKTLDEDERYRLRRSLWATVAYTHLDAPAKYVEAAAELPIGLCAGLVESGWAAVLSRPLLGDVREADYGRFGKLLEQTEGRCRVRRLRAAWQTGATVEDLETLCAGTEGRGAGTDPFCNLTGTVAWIPGGRRVMGELFFSIANPDWWRDYRPDDAPAGKEE